MTASPLRAAFVAAAASWAALLVIAPWAASAPHASPIASALIVAVYGIGHLVCHQLPERSYRLWTAQMPVCARCAGIYFGGVLGAFMALGVRAAAEARGFRARARARLTRASGRLAEAPSARQPSERRRPPERPALRDAWDARRDRLLTLHSRVLLALAVAPTVLTLAYEWATGVTPANGIRLAAGLPIGAVVAWLVVTASDNQVN